MVKYFRILIFFLFVGKIGAQTTYTVQPDPTAGKDALVHSLSANQNTNYGTNTRMFAMRWTSGGVPFSTRFYLQFDLSSIPSTAKICSATLTMYSNSDNYQSGSNRTNASYLKRNTASWDESTITWANQPSSFSESDKISTPSFTTTTVGTSFTVDVSSHVQTMVSDPSNNFGWVCMLQDETNTYTSLGMSTSDYTVTTTQRPMLSVTYVDVAVATSNAWRCSGTSANLTTTVTPAGTYTYSWSPSSTLNASNTASVVATPTATTNYSVTVTTGSGCSTTRTVTVNSQATPTITMNNPSACLGSGANITPTVSAGSSPNLTYSWTPGTYLNSTTNATVTSTPTVTGTFTYNVNVTNGSLFINCSQTATSTVTIGPPTLTITPTSATICAGNSTTLTATSSLSGTTYSWTPATGLNVTSGSVVTASPGSTTTYTLTGTNPTGCTSTKTVTVNVNALPNVTVSPSSGCVGTTATLTASGANTYTWSPATALSCTVCSAPVATPTTAITYTVTGTNTVTACTNTATATINALPTLTISPSSATICNGSSATFTASGANTYTWSSNAGSVTTSTVTVSPSSNTTYTVTGTNTLTACANTKTVSVTVNSLPNVTVSPSSGCVGTTATLTASGANTYTWSPATALSCTVCTAPVATPTAAITYTVTGTNTVTTCTNTKTVTINALPSLTVTPSAPTICSGASTTLTATGANTYTWSPITALSCSACASPVASPTSTITYTVTGTNTVTTCINTKAVTVSVNPTPTIVVNSDSIYVGYTPTLTATGATTYSWTPSTGLSATTGATVTASPTVTTSYTVTGTTNGCSASAVAVVTNLNLYYRSAATGNWNTLSTWESSLDNSSWSAAMILPDWRSNTITVRTHTVTITASVGIDQTTVNSGGVLSYGNNTGSTITIKNGTGTDLVVNGGFADIGPNSVSWATSSTWSLGSAASILRTRATSSDNWKDHYEGGISNIPATATWIVRKAGSDNPLLSSAGMYYPNLIVDNVTGTAWTADNNSNFTGSSDFVRIKGSFTLGGTGTGNTVNLTNGNTNATPMLVQGDMVIQSGSTLQNYGTGIELQANINVAGSLTYSNTAALTFSGGSVQSFSATGTTNLHTLKMNKSSNTLTLANAVSVDNSLVLTAGKIVTTTTNILTLKNGGTVTGGGFGSYIAGPIKKIGNSAFTFPIGKGNNYLPISITAPSNATDAYSAEYFNAGQTFGTALDSTMDTLSVCEYWDLTQTAGTSTVNVTARWDSLSCDVDSAANMRVAQWNGTLWQNMGATSITGNHKQGSITSGTPLGGTIGAKHIALGHYNYCLWLVNMTAQPGPPRTILTGGSVTLGGNPIATGTGILFNISGVTSSWSPSTGLSCTACSNPLANPATTTTYTLTVTFASCVATATTKVSLTNIQPASYLKKELDGGFFDVTTQRNPTNQKHLYFKFDEEYTNNGNNLTYTIYDKNQTPFTVPALSVVYKDNRYDLDLGSVINPVSGNNFYVLEAQDKKGDKFYLRFKY